MTDRPTPRMSRPWSLQLILGAIGVSATAAAGIAASVGALNSETLVTRAFTRALAGLEQQPSVMVQRTGDGQDGTEDYWLRAHDARIMNAAAVGQRIVLGSGAGARSLIILDVRDAGPAATHIDTAGGEARVLVVTCRDAARPEQGAIQLTIEQGRITSIIDDASGRAL